MTKLADVAERAPRRGLSLAGAQPRSVVAEVPFTRADSLDSIPDGLYMFNSTWHWQPIVNGYSGFFPKTFIELAEKTESFPDEESIAYLKQRRRRPLGDPRRARGSESVWGDDRSPHSATRHRGHGSV